MKTKPSTISNDMMNDSWDDIKLVVSNSQVKANSPCRKGWDAIRAEALSSAIFYSECTLNKVPGDAAIRAEELTTKQSKWWLPGNDPNHPSLQSSRSMPEDFIPVSSPSCKVKKDPTDAVEKKTTPHRPLRNFSADLVNVNEPEIEDNRVAARRNDLDAPLFAQDDDLGHGPLPSMSLICSSNSKTKGTIGKISIDRPSKLYGDPVDTIQSHSSHSRIHGSHRNRDHKRQCSAIENISNASKYVKISESRQDEMNALHLEEEIKIAKNKLLSSMKDDSVTDNPDFFDAVATLEQLYQSKLSFRSADLRQKKAELSSSRMDYDACIDGTWLMISPPEYPASVGENENGERLFTLGRMTFDMFEPVDLVCSIQEQYNTIRTVASNEKLPTYIPPSLRQDAEYEHKKSSLGRLKVHNIIASFTIEKGSRKNSQAGGIQKKLKGLLTNYGYTLPDPTNPNRNTIWFTAGTIEPCEEESLEEWKKLFSDNCSSDSAKAQCTNKAKSLASAIMLGAVSDPMNEKGTVGYYLTQPIGGHGYAFCDVIFMDEMIRVMRGHSGSILVFKRVFH